MQLPVTAMSLEIEDTVISTAARAAADARVEEILQGGGGGGGGSSGASLRSASIGLIGPLSPGSLTDPWQETGLRVAVPAGRRSHVSVSGVVGVSGLAIVQFAVSRKVGGSHTILLPSGMTSGAICRLGSTDDFGVLALQAPDLLGPDPAEYHLMWRCINSQAWLGRRGDSASLQAPTYMTVISDG